MKKWIALLLAAALALGCVPALAESYTVDQKFWGQVQENGLRVSVTFSVAGDKTALIAPETWAALQALAPRLSLEGENSAQKSGAGQAGARVLLDGQAVGMADVRYDNGLIAWTSDLLSDSGAFYAASQDWNPLELLETALRQNQAWPSLALALLSAKSAPQEWQSRAQPLLEPYQTKLGVWLNGYAVVSNGTQDGVAYTELACRIPVQAVKAEIKQLLIDFYADEALLSLLREVFTAQEAAAYLQSGMRDTFFTLLDQLEISGEAEYSMASGYVPVIKSVTENPVYADFLSKADGGNYISALSAKVCLSQADYYYTSPAFVGSSTARDQVTALLPKCLTMTGDDLDAQIEAAFEDAIDECEYAN